MKRLVAAMAFAFAMGTGAMAQNATMPEGWAGAIGDTFYSDSAAGTMRTQEEITAGWAKLTPEQQAQVKADCAKMPSDSSDANMKNICDWSKNM